MKVTNNAIYINIKDVRTDRKLILKPLCHQSRMRDLGCEQAPTNGDLLS